MKLTVISADAGLTRVRSSDDITLLDFEGGAKPLEALLGPEAYHGIVLLSLEQSLYIDSSAVGWLIQSHFRFQKAGGKLIIHSIPPMVHHCFRVLGMYDLLNLCENEAAALRLAQTHREQAGKAMTTQTARPQAG
jgi:anti-anti-sigma factor